MVNAQETFAYVDGLGKTVYEYYAVLTTPWDQEEGLIYWLDIALDPYDSRWTIAPDQVPTWGWTKTSDPVWGSQAISNAGWHWAPFNGPGDTNHHDRAFELFVQLPIPAVTEWGLVVMALLGLAAGTIMFRRTRAVAA
jgi:hypothetical protein